MLQNQRKFRGVFVVDLDGTLLNGRRRLGDRDLTGLRRLCDHDIAVVIATGRSRYSFTRLLATDAMLNDALSRYVCYVIFSTGAGIMDFPRGNILQTRQLSVKDVETISTRLAPFDVDYMIHEPIPGTRHFHFRAAGGGVDDFMTRIGLYQDFGQPCDRQTMSRIGEVGGATEVLCIVDPSRGESYVTGLCAVFPEYSVIRATSPLDHRSVWLEIFASGVSKSQATRWLTAQLGLCPEDVCAVGNDYNDVDLLHWAGRGYLVSNSPPELKKKYETVVSNDEGGVAQAAERWLKESKEK